LILLIDNYDSFTYNLCQLIGQMEPQLRMVRSGEITVDEIAKLRPDAIVISPGRDIRRMRECR
jgi:anthranilate synthase component II